MGVDAFVAIPAAEVAMVAVVDELWRSHFQSFL